MADVQIVIGRKYEVADVERRQATAELARWLRNSGVSVDLEVIEYEPGQYGLTPIEWTEFFIGTTVAGSVISNITTDLYNGAKKLLRDRREAKKAESGNPGRHLGFTIYGPDGQLIARWTTQEDVAEPDPAHVSTEKPKSD